MTTADTTTQRSGNAVTFTVNDGIAEIVIDQPGKPVNVLSSEVVAELEAAVNRLRDPATGARAAIIASGKKGVWIAGADVEQLAGIQTAADGEALSRGGQELVGRLEKLPIPVVAAIDGAALGGGLEMALACTYRIASDSRKTKLGLPEVQLGLLPGAGGSQRLPRLVGLRTALDLMLTGKQLDGRRAKKAGLVDEVVPEAILMQRARQAAADLAGSRLQPSSGRRRGSPQWVENLPGLRQFILHKAREGVMEKTGGLYPAPLRILDVVASGLDKPLDRALEDEARGFGDLSVTPESKALTHIFFASTAAKNDPMLPEGATPSSVERVAVVGAGFMGAGIATVTAESGMRVRLKDISAEGVAKGMETAHKSIRKRASRRRRPEHEVTALLDRIEGTVEYTGFGSTDMVVEAVFEDVDLKHEVIGQIEAASSPDTVIASNTSTIPITTLAEGAGKPERVIGLHFFSPVEKMPLVEIITGPATDPSVTATCHAYSKAIGKTPIIVNDAPGFYVNRILGPYMNEAALLLEQGVSMEAIDKAITGWGFPVGPITLYDEVGLEVAAKSGQILSTAFAHRMEPSNVVQKLIDDGRKGRKNGRGFYRYENGEKAGPDESVYPLIGAPTRTEMPAERIVERLVLGLVNEAIRTLEDGVLRTPRDGDVGAVFGFGFPPFRGGPFWYADERGLPTLVERLRALEQQFGERYSPAALLVDKAAKGERFFPGGAK